MQLPGLVKDLIEWMISKYSQRHHFRNKLSWKWKWFCYKMCGIEYVDASDVRGATQNVTLNYNNNSHVKHIDLPIKK